MAQFTGDTAAAAGRATADGRLGRRRLLAAASGAAVLCGATTMLVALVAAPGPSLRGYVSEAGTAGRPTATAYRVGLVVLAVGVALLGAALRPVPGFRAVARTVAPALFTAAVLAGTSGTVPCTDRCPLPPFEPTTWADVVHSAASILGVAVLAFAMVALALSPEFRAAPRRLAACAAGLTVPLGAALGLTMLLAGRGPVGAVLERLLLAVAVSWLVGAATLTALRHSVRVEAWRIPPSPTGSRRSSGGSPS
jgi:Protein of unknown function (DUF998)